MTDSFSYTTTYPLDKSHFTETFEQTAVLEAGFKAYRKAAFFALVGAVALFFDQVSAYFAWFMVGLGVVEALSVRFKKPWWVTRQMWSRAANNKVTLTIDDKAITTSVLDSESTILWENLTAIQATSQGWMLIQGKARFYLSGRVLSGAASDFIQCQSEAIAAASQPASEK